MTFDAVHRFVLEHVRGPTPVRLPKVRERETSRRSAESNRWRPTKEVIALKALKTFAALLLALGVLTTAPAGFAKTEGDEVQAPRTHGGQDIQAP